MAVLKVDATRQHHLLVKNVVLGVGVIDPLHGHQWMMGDLVTRLVIVSVFAISVGKSQADQFVDHRLLFGDRLVEEGFAVHLDALVHESPEILDDFDFHSALRRIEHRATHLVADPIVAPHEHVDLDGLAGFANPPQHGVEACRRTILGLRVIKQGDGGLTRHSPCRCSSLLPRPSTPQARRSWS